MKLTKRQDEAFTQEPGEDAYEHIVRTMRTRRPRDLPRLYLTLTDPAQREAIRLMTDVRMVVWTRMLAYGTLILGVCTIVAALIVR